MELFHTNKFIVFHEILHEQNLHVMFENKNEKFLLTLWERLF